MGVSGLLECGADAVQKRGCFEGTSHMTMKHLLQSNGTLSLIRTWVFFLENLSPAQDGLALETVASFAARGPGRCCSTTCCCPAVITSTHSRIYQPPCMVCLLSYYPYNVHLHHQICSRETQHVTWAVNQPKCAISFYFISPPPANGHGIASARHG